MKCERVGACSPTRFRLNSIKHAFVQIVGMCAFVYIAVVLFVEDTVRNILYETWYSGVRASHELCVRANLMHV